MHELKKNFFLGTKNNLMIDSVDPVHILQRFDLEVKNEKKFSNKIHISKKKNH